MRLLTSELITAGVESWVLEAIGAVQEACDRRMIAEVVGDAKQVGEFVYDRLRRRRARQVSRGR
jgi:hypothetical protein